MGVWIAAAATAVGAGLSFMGASENAKAAAQAAEDGMEDENALYKKWSGRLDSFVDSKEKKLYDLGGIFKRFESTGAFGKTDTLKNLRKAQEDFSALAAGDFSGFESQLRKNMSDALVNTVGSGSPVGTFAELAADTQLNMRLQGVQTSVGITESISQQANNLLGLEFGLMDQRFQVGYEMESSKVRNINNLRTQQASTAGVDWMSAGMGVSQIGNTIGSAVQYGNNQKLQQQSHERQMAQINSMGGKGGVSLSGYSNMESSYSSKGGLSAAPVANVYGTYPDNISTVTSYPAIDLPDGVSYPASNINDMDLLLPSRDGTDGAYSTSWQQMSSNPYSQIGTGALLRSKQ